MCPIGIPTLEDKVLQRAILMVLEPIYEQDFLDCSYGFRPGRCAHQALQALWQGLKQMGGGWIIDFDFGSVNLPQHTYEDAPWRERIEDRLKQLREVIRLRFVPEFVKPFACLFRDCAFETTEV